MTPLEKAARALAEHFGCEWETIREADREIIRGYVRAVLMAVREPEDDFMLALYPNPAGREGVAEIQGRRSRDAGKMQIAHFIDHILRGGETG